MKKLLALLPLAFCCLMITSAPADKCGCQKPPVHKAIKSESKCGCQKPPVKAEPKCGCQKPPVKK